MNRDHGDRHRPTGPARIAGIVLLLCSMLGGCTSKPPLASSPPGGGTSELWSTKEASILGRSPGEAPLELEPLPSFPVAETTLNGPELRAAAIDLLWQAMDSQSALLRANAIEGMQYAPRYLAEVAGRGLVDDNRGVRFVTAMVIGRDQLKSVARLAEPLLRDPSDSVRAAAIYALYRNGIQVSLAPLGEMLRSEEPEVKANAAMILGDLGNRSAAPMLRQAKGQGLQRTPVARMRLVDMQIAEALVKLGDEEEIQGIRAALFAPPEQGELTALACQISAHLNDGRVVNNLNDLAMRTGERQQSPEVRMAAVAALAEIDPSQASMSVPLQFVTSEREELRAQAAMTLGAVRQSGALPTLSVMMGDTSPLVQVAAAAAIVRITA